MKYVLKQFKVYAPPIEKANALNKDGTLTITGVASTTNQDLDGEVISEKALKSLQNQAVGLNLHLDHNHDYNGGIGAITEAHIEKNALVITANVLPEHAKGIQERLGLGMNMGFSIGGIPIIKNSRSNIIDDFILLEISLTLLPANWDTFGTVGTKNLVESNCLTGACHYILSEKSKKENLVSDTMEEKAKVQSGKVIDDATKQELVDIVNEAIINLKPLILDELKEEMVKLVQDVVATALGDVVPKAIDEIKAQALPEPVEEEEVPVEEPVEEEKAEEPTNEEVVEVEEKAEEEEQTEEPVEEEIPTDEIVEEEKEVPTKVPVSGIPASPSDVSYAETTQTITAPTYTIDSKAIAEQVIAEVWKQLDAHRDIVEKETKLDEYKSEQKEITTKSKFLDSPTRDKHGRNRKYL